MLEEDSWMFTKKQYNDEAIAEPIGLKAEM